jgi:hypothetical protein
MRGAIAAAGVLVVQRERLRRAISVIERDRERAVQLATALGRHRGGDDRLHALVIRLDLVGAPHAGHAHEVSPREPRHRIVVAGRAQRGRVRGDLVRDGRACDRDDLEQCASRRGQCLDACEQRALEIDRPLRAAGSTDRVVHELGDEQGMATGVARDHVGIERSIGGERVTERACELRTCTGVERSDVYLLDAAARCAQHRRRRVVVERLQRGDQQRRERAPRREQLGEQLQAIRLGVVEIVDREDHHAFVGEGGEQLAQGRERRHPQGRVIVAGRDLRARTCDRRHAREHGKYAYQRVDAIGQSVVEARCTRRREVMRETVDDAVDRAVRHELARVAAGLEHDERRSVAPSTREELLDEARLADAGLAMDERADRLAVACRLERAIQRVELAVATDKPGLGDDGQRLASSRGAEPAVEQLEHLAHRRALLRLGGEQARA